MGPPAARWGAVTLALLFAATLGGCASTPANISLPSDAGAATPAAEAADVRVSAVKWKRVKPQCKGECPAVEVDSVAFPGIPRLTQLVDHVLAYMTGIDSKQRGPYETLDEYAQYFWRTAQPRDSTHFNARVKDTVGDYIVLELRTEQYVTGAAHPIPATQYLNWQRSAGRVMALDEAIIPGREQAFADQLRKAYNEWLKTNEAAQRDPDAYARAWPFHVANNFAFTRDGVTVKYQAYSIAPYVYGQPELTIPYRDLVGVFRPEVLRGLSGE